MKRTPKSIKKNCDKLFSQIVRSRGKCERCGGINGKLETAHIFSRKYGSVRFDKNNTLCLDSRCHRWAHDNPTEFTNYLYQTKGIEKIHELEQKKNQLCKRKLSDWLELEKQLKLILDKTTTRSNN